MSVELPEDPQGDRIPADLLKELQSGVVTGVTVYLGRSEYQKDCCWLCYQWGARFFCSLNDLGEYTWEVSKKCVEKYVDEWEDNPEAKKIKEDPKTITNHLIDPIVAAMHLLLVEGYQISLNRDRIDLDGHDAQDRRIYVVVKNGGKSEDFLDINEAVTRFME